MNGQQHTRSQCHFQKGSSSSAQATSKIHKLKNSHAFKSCDGLQTRVNYMELNSLNTRSAYHVRIGQLFLSQFYYFSELFTPQSRGSVAGIGLHHHHHNTFQVHWWHVECYAQASSYEVFTRTIAKTQTRNYFAPVGWPSIVMSMSVCLSVHLHNSKTTRSNFTKFFWACCLWFGPLLTALRYVMQSRFADDVMISDNGPMGRYAYS